MRRQIVRDDAPCDLCGLPVPGTSRDAWPGEPVSHPRCAAAARLAADLRLLEEMEGPAERTVLSAWERTGR